LKTNLLRKVEQENHEGEESWAISYGDMITLLLSFFVLFFSTDFDKEKKTKSENHLMAKFNASIENGPIHEITPQMEPIASMMPKAKVTRLENRLLVTFDQMGFFSSGEVEPNMAGVEILKKFATKYVPYAGQYRLSIKSFTDNKKVNNDVPRRFKDNLELSVLRSVAVMRVLQQAGIPLNRMEIAGQGEMTKILKLLSKLDLTKLNEKELNDISRTVVLVIKHDDEQGVL
jgi:chemotaxis protein MotB